MPAQFEWYRGYINCFMNSSQREIFGTGFYDTGRFVKGKFQKSLLRKVLLGYNFGSFYKSTLI